MAITPPRKYNKYGEYLKFGVKRLTETAIIPTKANLTDAGWDIYADQHVELLPGDITLISTGISLEIPDGYVGLIWDRSSLGVKGVHRHAGVIDSGYRGEVKVCLHNTKKSGSGFIVSQRDRIAQILLQEVPLFRLEEIQELSSTARGSGGFGSSGK